MPSRVSWNIQDPEFQPKFGKGYVVAAADTAAALRNRFSLGTDDRHVVTSPQGDTAADVIHVVMSDEDGAQAEALALERLDDRIGVPRVDHGHIATITQAVDDPDIVIAERLHRRCF